MDRNSSPRLAIGLVGFRCCGKSTLRRLLSESHAAVFDTNSVSTGDPASDTMDIKSLIERYGRGKSYLYFLEDHIREFAAGYDFFFVDSLKAAADLEALSEILPDYETQTWYLHCRDDVRKQRYFERDIKPLLRAEPLEQHDASLIESGIFSLVRSATEVINMDKPLDEIRKQLHVVLRDYR